MLFETVPVTQMKKMLLLYLSYQQISGQPCSKADTSLEQVIPLSWCQRFAQVEIKGLTAGF